MTAHDDDEWRTTDFRPDPAGFRAVFIPTDPAVALVVRRVAGWMIQEWRGELRVMAAVVDPDDGEVLAVDLADGHLCDVLDPGAPDPTPEQERQAREWRANQP